VGKSGEILSWRRGLEAGRAELAGMWLRPLPDLPIGLEAKEREQRVGS